MWIELHDHLPDHPKIVKLSVVAKMDRDLARAKLERLWLWALTNRLNGVLSEDDVYLLPDVMRLKGTPTAMVDALIQCGLLDRIEGGYVIHDWDEHVGMLRDRREAQREQSRLRKQRQREKQRDQNVTCHAGVTRDQRDSHAVTVPIPYLNHTITDYTKNNEKEIDKEKAPPKTPVRHKHGAYRNVLLSDDELDKLRAEFPADWEERIERLSEYIASKGAKYKDHLATIRAWARKDGVNGKRRQDTSADPFGNVGIHV